MIRTTAAGALIALATLTGTPAYASATDDVRGAMLRFAGLSSYEMTFGKGAQQGTMDVVKPDSMHMRAGGMEMIRVGTTTYFKQGARGWMKIHDTPGAGPAAMADKVRKMAREANGISATDLGWKNVDGESLHAYRMTSKDGSPSTVYIARDGYCHRIDSGNEGGVIRFGKFNAIGPIRPPI